MNEQKTAEQVAADLIRQTLQQIADMPRKTREQKLAKACLGFVDSLIDHKPDTENE